jgi:plasmid rolling circle replication initiator protein Rep
MESPLQPFGDKLPPVPRAGFATGNEAEEGRAPARYVHTSGTSSQVVGWTGTSREGEQIKREYSRQKTVNSAVDSLRRCYRHKEALALSQCGQRFTVWAKSTGEVKLLPIYCDSPFCPECSHRRARPLIKSLKGKVNRRGRSYWHLVLTTPNIEGMLKLDVLQIQDNWSKLWESWVFQEVEDENGKAFRIYGGVRSVEVTYNEKLKSWHLHLHVLFEAPKRLPWWWLILLKAAWNGLNDTTCYVRLDRAYSVTKRGTKKFGRLNEKALREVCKYVTKCANFAEDHILVNEFLTAFRGVRRIQCFGSFYGAKAKETERQPGEDESGIADVSSTLCSEGYQRLPFEVPISHTFLSRQGERQLCSPYRQMVRDFFKSESPPWALSVERVATTEQRRLGFPGAMPEKSERQASLFDAVA